MVTINVEYRSVYIETATLTTRVIDHTSNQLSTCNETVLGINPDIDQVICFFKIER